MKGRPRALRCPQCFRTNLRGAGTAPSSFEGIVKTGRTRERWCPARRGRVLRTQFEVRHTLCGRTWWTTHPGGLEAVRTRPDPAADGSKG